QGITRLTDSFHLNLTAFGFLAFAVGIFIVHAAIGLAFEQRRPMFRTLRAVGLSAQSLAALVLVEMLGFALIAGLAGVGLGYLVAAALLPDVAATLGGLYGAAVPGSLSLRPSWVIAGLGMAVLGTLVAAGQGLIQVWRMPPLASAEARAWAVASGRARGWQAGAGLGLLVLAGVALASGGGLWAGFAVLAGLLLGAALLLPPLLARALALAGSRARAGSARWSQAFAAPLPAGSISAWPPNFTSAPKPRPRPPRYKPIWPERSRPSCPSSRPRPISSTSRARSSVSPTTPPTATTGRFWRPIRKSGI
ncbi:MAG: hypothetical protein B7Z31_16075, partial [Rhodobacterales bacterium 12-65-15]